MPFLQVLACVAILNAVVNIAVYLATIVAGEFTNCLLHLVRFGQILRSADKRIVNIMKVFIESNNL